MKSAPGQRWIDICLQCTGEEEALFELAMANGVGITDPLTAGTTFVTIEGDISKSALASLLSGRPPASAWPDTATSPGQVDEGLEFWALEDDFIIT